MRIADIMSAVTCAWSVRANARFVSRLLVSMAACLASYPVLSQQIIGSDKYFDERLRGATVGSLGNNLFGDSINLKDGTFEFSQDDVSVPTNSGLRLAFGRQNPKHPQGLDRNSMPLGAAWEINAPYMVARYDNRRGWDARGSSARCSSPDLSPSSMVGPSPDYNTMVIPIKYFWTGIHINIPGAGYETLLSITSQNQRPNDGATYIGSTRGDWRVSCLSALKNGSGEGFVVRLPNGEKYYFDWTATRDAPDVLSNEYYKDETGNGTAPPYLLVPTSDVFIYATKVEDRLGNYVLYNYDAANPHHLTSIQSSEGSRIDIDYDLNGKVSTVRSGGEAWTYRYSQTYWGYSLSEVELPDNSKWTFSGDIMYWKMTPMILPGSFYDNTCAQNAAGYRQSDSEEAWKLNTIVVQHPSGAIGEFKTRRLIHGSDNTPGSCGIVGTSQSDFSFSSFGIPNAYLVPSLVSKKITGAGVNSLWSYRYSPHWSFQNSCSLGCYSTTTVNEPSGEAKTYTFGNSYTENFGDLLNERIVVSGQVMKSTRYVRKSSTGDFPDSYGGVMTEDNPLQYKVRPVQTVEQTVDGVTFTRTNNTFDAFARPIKVTKSSAPAP